MNQDTVQKTGNVFRTHKVFAKERCVKFGTPFFLCIYGFYDHSLLQELNFSNVLCA